MEPSRILEREFGAILKASESIRKQRIVSVPGSLAFYHLVGPQYLTLGRTSKEKRAKAIAEDESKRGESCKKGEPAYLTVTVVKGSALRFQWKDAKRPIGSIDKVTFEPGWDVDRAEFEAKLAYDSYWSYEMGQYNRRLVVYTGCLILRTSAQAKASGPPLAHSSGLSLQGPMEKPLIREIDEATASKIRRHQKMFAERMGASRAGQSH